MCMQACARASTRFTVHVVEICQHVAGARRRTTVHIHTARKQSHELSVHAYARTLHTIYYIDFYVPLHFAGCNATCATDGTNARRQQPQRCRVHTRNDHMSLRTQGREAYSRWQSSSKSARSCALKGHDVCGDVARVLLYVACAVRLHTSAKIARRACRVVGFKLE